MPCRHLVALLACLLAAAPEVHALPAVLPSAIPHVAAAGVVADARGMTLYTYDADAPGSSRCAGPCARVWPPLPAPAGAVAAPPFGIVDRADGSRQWSLGRRPLYRYAGDVRPGQASGDGVNGVWHVARVGH